MINNKSYMPYMPHKTYEPNTPNRPLLSIIIYSLVFIISSSCLFSSCTGSQKKGEGAADTIALAPAPAFVADSAMAYIEAQCAFGPRVPGNAAHAACGDWIVQRFQALGAEVSELRTTLDAYNGKPIPCRNIQARMNPESADRILLTAHWDSRAWADNDPDNANHHTPVLAANDGASGVAVMLEIARLIRETGLSYGIDFICFDAEDQGTPEWAEEEGDDAGGYWCLGSRYWAQQASVVGYRARYGVNLDMVGGRGACFCMEGFSRQFAGNLVHLVWQIARQLGFGDYFLWQDGGYVTDDHLSINRIARIPCIDIVPSVEGAASSFGPTWHTTNDTPEHIDPAVLRAVGQTILQLIYNDNETN